MTSSVLPPMTSPFVADAAKWWAAESGDWDALVDSTALPGGSSLWGGMPAVDSKAVARLSPIFEKHFGVPLDPKLIRPGGYDSIEQAARDIEAKYQASRASTRPATPIEAHP